VRINDNNPNVGRKQSPSNLNLVPFIDLFSMIIIFLVITAVFDRIAALQVNMGAEDSASVTVPQQDLKKVKADLKVTIGEKALTLFDAGRVTKVDKEIRTDENGEQVEGFNKELLAQFFAEARNNHPEKKDIVIFSQDKANYIDLVVVMDMALGEKFTDLIVTGSQQ